MHHAVLEAKNELERKLEALHTGYLHEPDFLRHLNAAEIFYADPIFTLND